MLFRLLLILLIALQLQADDIIQIQSGSVNISAAGYLYVAEQKEGLDSAEKILKADSEKFSKTSLFSMSKGPFWSRMTLKNESSTHQELILSSIHPGADYLDVYLYNGSMLERTVLLGDMRPQNEREILHRLSSFRLDLSPGETRTIVIRTDNPGFYRLEWRIEDFVSFHHNNNGLDFFFTFIGAITLFILIHVIGLYTIYRSPVYIIGAVEALGVTFYVYALYGFMYELDIGIPLELISLFAWIILYFNPIMRFLFPIFFFDMKKSYPRLIRLNYTFIGIFLIGAVLIMWARYADPSFFAKVIPAYIVIFFIYPFGLLIIAGYLFRKKEEDSGYFLTLQLLFTVIVTLHTLFFLQVIPSVWYSQYLMHVALLSDAVAMIVLQYLKSKKIYDANRREKEILLNQSRFYSIGKSVGYVTHQWKTPLSRISAITATFESFIHFDKEKATDYIIHELPHLKTNIKLMAETIDEINNFYATSLQKTSFAPKKLIEKNILELLESKSLRKSVHFELEIDEQLIIETYAHIFANLIIVLIDNSIDAFKTDANQVNTIWIRVVKEISKIHVEYSDNAGGIKIEPVEKIFEFFISEKEDTSGHGLGLGLAKMLVTDQLHGSITAENIDNGARFSIIF